MSKSVAVFGLINLGLAIAGVGCGEAMGDRPTDYEWGETDSPLYSPTNTRLWPGGVVNVCFRGSSYSSNAAKEARLAAWRANVKTWVLTEIEPHASLKFNGFGSCPSGAGRTWLKLNVVSTSNSSARDIGYVSDNQIDFGQDRENQGVVLHEFMHKLGFGHEFNRSDSDACSPAQTRVRTGTFWTPHDPTSIMNSTYCHNNAVLSALDKVGLLAAYPYPPPPTPSVPAAPCSISCGPGEDLICGSFDGCQLFCYSSQWSLDPACPAH